MLGTQAKTRLEGRVCIPGEPGKLGSWRTELPLNRRRFQARDSRYGRSAPGARPFWRAASAARETALLSFVPVHFAVYRPLKPRLRWAMQCLVGYADHAGRCFPSLRTFAVQAGISKSAAGRDLAELEAEGHLTRTRRPGSVYIYRIARRFLPRWARE